MPAEASWIAFAGKWKKSRAEKKSKPLEWLSGIIRNGVVEDSPTFIRPRIFHCKRPCPLALSGKLRARFAFQ